MTKRELARRKQLREWLLPVALRLAYNNAKGGTPFKEVARRAVVLAHETAELHLSKP